MPAGTIDVEHLWKRFRADRSPPRLADRIDRVKRVLRGDTRAAAWRWALRDVSLHADAGESIGLIGFNGSGKSTLLRMLSRVMYPYAGTIAVGGRVAALIEVVSGIHQELTGRENMFLYGSLTGLSRAAVGARFDEMVAFAELEDAIDRQVKFYSLGMQMRLGFAVRSFLESDVLLVDEVLAVGDATFQQKCLDQMRTVLNRGTTLVLVSHDLAAVEATCRRCVWLHGGRVALDGPADDVLGAYRQFVEHAGEGLQEVAGARLRLRKVEVFGPGGGTARTQAPMDVLVTVDSDDRLPFRLWLGASNGPATPIWLVRRDMHVGRGETRLRCRVTNLPLPKGRFSLWVSLAEIDGPDVVPWHAATSFDVHGPSLDDAPLAVVRMAPVHVDVRWRTERDR